MAAVLGLRRRQSRRRPARPRLGGLALRTLIALHNALDRRLGLTPAERPHYEEVYGQVWLMVKDMLGHRSEQVTRDVYLCTGCSWSRCSATTTTP